ncbi:FSR family fosmidomycin resistance protein-like MFS transporter [Tumebacillus sp. BK434]|uniref:MFS transporter n=1 Tax=Tumebacillus sp. BK434 TaxID=2512169 RepID=UPI00104E8C88|nr:MFS transporter [Tumebacillus sp. BK434]TCP59622.1 FSR family fosmidomycin resistance protein-like MFS transporter [Tumebacillus sp. BK434]
MQTVAKANVQSSPNGTMYRILFAISFVHLLNDTMQAVIPAVYPTLRESMALTFTQVGLISFAFNMTSSVLQPVVGFWSDKKPKPFLLPFGMALSMIGMLGLAFAPNYLWILFTVLFVGLGSAVFHPEGSKVAYLAAGTRRGFAQSVYQVGGNTGSSLAPLMTALIFVPLGQFGAIWFTSLAAVAIVVCLFVSSWYTQQLATQALARKSKGERKSGALKRQIGFAIVLLTFLVFARSWYSSGLSNYYQFYLIDHYGLSISKAQVFIFLFMIAGVIGTFIGGPLADRFGKRRMIFFSMLGAAPFALLLPHVSLLFAYPLLFVIGVILSTSWSVTVVYAQELIPGKIGTVSGLIVGLAFGLGAIGSVALGKLSDLQGLDFTMLFCSFLPLLGLLTYLLPTDRKLKEWEANA